MRKWRSHKIVEAEPIVSTTNAVTVKTVTVEGFAAGVETRFDVPENFFARGTPEPGDYLVRYDGGYLSWSPKAAFEDGYTELRPGTFTVTDKRKEAERELAMRKAVYSKALGPTAPMPPARRRQLDLMAEIVADYRAMEHVEGHAS